MISESIQCVDGSYVSIYTCLDTIWYDTWSHLGYTSSKHAHYANIEYIASFYDVKFEDANRLVSKFNLLFASETLLRSNGYDETQANKFYINSLKPIVGCKYIAYNIIDSCLRNWSPKLIMEILETN